MLPQVRRHFDHRMILIKIHVYLFVCLFLIIRRSPLVNRRKQCRESGTKSKKADRQTVSVNESPKKSCITCRNRGEKARSLREFVRNSSTTMVIEHFIDRYRQKKTSEHEPHHRENSTSDDVLLDENCPDKTWQVILSLG